MGEGRTIEGALLSFGPGGTAGVHGERGMIRLRVGPATETQHNTLRPGTFPIACWRANDANFEFDSSFPRPELAREMAMLQALRERHPGAPLSLFGHADPVGNEEHNKALSGRRARAIFALLTRQPSVFEELFQHGDWGDRALRQMLAATEPDATPSDERVQKVRANAGARRTLYAAYMDALCRDESGALFQLAAGDFLGGGRDPGAKADVQGCGEFNPVLLFAQAEHAAFEASKDKEPRNRENAPNRRVVALLFRPGVQVDPARWPCPRASEGTAACRKRFWSDHAQRRKPAAGRRLAEESHDTFACRFYDRLTAGSPCERSIPLMRPFRYGLQMDREVPWTDAAILRFASEDEQHVREFRVSEGAEAKGMRVFTFEDYRRGVKYLGQIVQGDHAVTLFGPCELWRVQNPFNEEEVLPLPRTAPAAEPKLLAPISDVVAPHCYA